MCDLECWHPAIRNRHPQLDIVMVKKGNVRTLGVARWQKHHIRLRIQVGKHDRYEIMETIVHEIAHIDAQRRENDAAKAAGRTRVQVSHGPDFWKSNDMGFEVAYPGAMKFVGPRINNYHGRYAKALREQAASDNFWAGPTRPKLEEKVPGVYLWSERPAAAATKPEPKVPRSLIELLPGGSLPPRPQPKPVPKTIVEAPGVKVPSAILDERVRLIVQELVISDRDEIQKAYEKAHGNYPGKSVYNSLWRLRRDAKIKREGHDWVIA